MAGGPTVLDDIYKNMDDIEVKSYERLFPSDETGIGWMNGSASARTLKAIYQTEDWIYILVDRIAAKLAQIPWQVFQQTTNNGEEVLKPALGHPAQKILDNPNPLQSDYGFKYASITDLCVTGNTLIYLSRSQRWLVQVPTEIINLDIQSNGDLRGYDIVGIDPQNFPVGMRTKIRPQDMIHIKRPNSSSVYWGLSPLVPGANSALFNKYSSEYLLNFYRKGAQPGIVLEMGEESNETQAKKLLTSLETAYTGRANQRRGLILPKGVKANNLAHTLADQQLIEYIRNNRETLINIYGVPKHELSIAESGSLGSEEYKTALKNFWQGPLMSIGKMFEGSLTQALSPYLGQGYVIRLNYSTVPILQEDLKERADTASAMLSTLTYNEVRQRIWKLPPIEGGDVLRDLREPSVPSFNPNLFSTEPPRETLELEAGTTKEEVPDVRQDNARAFADHVKAEENVWFRQSQTEQESASKVAISAMEKLWLDTLSEQIVKIVDAAKQRIQEKSAEVPSKRKLRREIEAAMDEVEDQWRDGYVDNLEGQVELGYKAALAIPFNEPYRPEIEAIRERDKANRRATLTARALEAFELTSRTTTEKIMQVIEQGVSESRSLAEITRSIMDVAKNSAYRAQRIARTETLIANSIGEAAAIKDAATVIPDLVKVWINANDERVRGNPGGEYPDSKADHWSLMGEVKAFDETFSNGLRHPRDLKGPAHEIINCRCSLVTVSAKDLDRLGLKR
jgi:HK97 family phage portal protein